MSGRGSAPSVPCLSAACQTSKRLLLAQVAALEQQVIELRKQGLRFGLPKPSELLSSLGLDRGFSRTSSAANLDLEAQKKDLSRASYARSACFQAQGKAGCQECRSSE